MEETLVLIKPDATKMEVWLEIIDTYRGAGLEIVKTKLMPSMEKDTAEQFYQEHKGKGFFEKLISFMTSGLMIALYIKGDKAIQKVRDINGATNPKEALPGTIRKKYGKGGPKNIVHGSDSEESAKRELLIIFADE